MIKLPLTFNKNIVNLGEKTMRILSSDATMQTNHSSSFTQKQKIAITVLNTADHSAADKSRAIA
jgi:hypothetical protein